MGSPGAGRQDRGLGWSPTSLILAVTLDSPCPSLVSVTCSVLGGGGPESKFLLQAFLVMGDQSRGQVKLGALSIPDI